MSDARPDRRNYLGSADIAGVLGISPFATPLSVWERKVAQEPEQPDPSREKFFSIRKRMEPVVGEMLQDQLGVPLSRLSWAEPNRYTDPFMPWMKAEVDAEFASADPLVGKFPAFASLPVSEPVNVEIKTVNARARHLWGEEGSEDVPPYYAAQVYWQMMITRRNVAILAAFFGLDELRVFPIVRTAAADQAIAAMRLEAIRFWSRNVLDRIPPPPVNLEEIQKMYSRISGRPVELSADGLRAFTEVLRLRELSKDVKKQKELAEFALFDEVRKHWGIPSDPTAAFPEDDAVLLFEGKPIGTWKRQNGAYLDQPRLAAELPEVVAKFTNKTVFRVLRRWSQPRGKTK